VSDCLVDRRRRPLILLVGLSLLGPAALRAGDESPAGEPRKPTRITFGGDSDTPPYEYLDAQGRPQGFNIELMRALGREAGVAVEFRLGRWSQVLAQMDAGRIDVMAMGYSDARAARYDFIGETWTLHQVIAFQPGRRAYPRHLRELGDEVVALMDRGKIHDLIEQTPMPRQPRLWLTANVRDALAALIRGDATAAGGNVLTLHYVAAEQGASGLIELPAHSVPYLLAVAKGRAGEQSWIPRTLARLKENGEFARLVETLLTLPARPLTWREYLRPVGGLLAVVGMLAAGIVAWNRSLRHKVAARTRELAVLLAEKDRLAVEIRASAERYRRLVESVHAIVWRSDPRMSLFSFVSKEAETVLGYPLDCWTAETGFFARHVHGDDRERVRALTEEAAAPGKQDLEFRMIAADGRTVWFRGVVDVVVEGSGPELVGVMVDVTQHKRLEEQFRQAQKMEAVGRLAGGVAHDFNNILTAIAAYAELMLRRLHKDDPLRDRAEGILGATERAAALTRQLLAFSRKQVLAPAVLDLNAVVREIEGMLGRVIGEDVRLVTRLGSGLGAVKADPGQIGQVIMNLAVNGRDAMPRGGTLTIETARVDPAEAATASPEAGEVMLAVQDTGVGMDDEVRSHIFEPFFTTKEAGKGTGLGLATVYGIVEQSGGRIAVDSTPARGTTVRIFLPRIADQAEGAARGSSVTHLPDGSGTILVVEDEEHVREMIRQVLVASGYTVIEARHAGEALVVVERHAGPIDLLLTDVVMPDMGGWELAERAAPLRPGLKALFVSGYAEDAVMQLGVPPDSLQFLSKPFTPVELIRRVRELLQAPG
jgi:PAS domain S-box-containing protein